MRLKSIAGFAISVSIICAVFSALSAQELHTAPPESLNVAATQPETTGQVVPSNLQDINSLWQLTQLGGGIRWGIFFVFGLALLFILKKLIELGLDLLNSRKLEHLEFELISLAEMRQFVLGAKQSLLSTLMRKLFDIFENTRNVNTLNDELSSFISLQKEHFSRFHNRMNFLADTAGALGLLGTVWGMFVTFFGGSLDTQRILHGMGVALITTLLGLVVSIVINFASTEVSNFFNRRMERIFEIADELKMRLFLSKSSASVENEMDMLAPPMLNGLDNQRGEIRLRGISELKQAAAVGKHLSKPLAVQTVTSNGVPVDGVEVFFEVIGNGGYFVDKQMKYSVTSNKRGQAEASFLLSGEVGERNVLAYVNGEDGARLEFQISGIPGPPAKLASVSGNHQSAGIGQRLGKPFVVAVTDAFGNPVRDCMVVFTITKGAGRFARYNPEIERNNGGITGIFKRKFLTQKVTLEQTTDSQGIAEAHLVLGPLPGVNEVTAVAKGLSKSPVIFDAMAQPEEEVAT